MDTLGTVTDCPVVTPGYWRGLRPCPLLTKTSGVLAVITVARYLVGMVLKWWPWKFPELVAEKNFND